MKVCNNLLCCALAVHAYIAHIAQLHQTYKLFAVRLHQFNA